MEVISKSIVLNLSRQMGLLVLELENCTQWSMIDPPLNNVVGCEAQVLKKGRSHYIQFDGDSTKFAADAM